MKYAGILCVLVSCFGCDNLAEWTGCPSFTAFTKDWIMLLFGLTWIRMSLDEK